MALGKYLIQHTGGTKVWGDNCSEHWYWGYIAQLDWQRRSGRFEDPREWKDEVDDDDAAIRNCCEKDDISDQSWWGYMNLNFSIAVYFGASAAGIVPPVSLSSKTTENDPSFQRCVSLWRDYFLNDHACFLESYEKDYDRATLRMYQRLWPVHTEIVKVGTVAAKSLGELLPVEDRDAGIGWCQMVELLSATNWPLLSLDSLHKFGGGYLPSMRLAGPKTMEWMKEHRIKEFTTVKSLFDLKDMSDKTMRNLCNFWSRVAYWDFARKNLPRYLDVVTHGNPLSQFFCIINILGLALFPHSVYEAGVGLAFISILAKCYF